MTAAIVDEARKITVLGIGNALYTDEGLGVQILPRLESALKGVADIEFIDGTTEGMQLLGPVEATQALIVIDAINAGKEPGTCIKLEKKQIPSFNGIKMSVHQIGFQEVLSAAQLRDRLPEKMVMIGIQPASLELGTEMSPTVQSAIPGLIKQVKKQIHEWRDD
nr:HyaD/HybD family hydrogenase maturation endopeptidase [Sporolactobacillus pectinivorans]